MGKLTAVKIRSLSKPGRYSDGDGLFLELNGRASGRWLLRIQTGGRRRDIGLGSLSSVSLADAREVAFETRRQIARGIDPVAEKKKQSLIVPTFREAAKAVHEEYRKGWKNGKHQKQWLSTLETYAFPAVGNLLVDEIEGPQIRSVLAPIWLTKPETARRVRQRITIILDWACAEGIRPSEAPIRSISRSLPRQPKKDRHFAAMHYREVPASLKELREGDSIGRLALEALILTATRSGEIRGARWSELDLKRKIWTIPAERMKTERAHKVPLSPQAIALLERARKFQVEASDLIFPGQSPTKPLSDMTLLKILRDKGLGVTVHGFRSSFRDWVADETDFPGEVAEAALAHVVPDKVEAVCKRTVFFEKRRRLMNEWEKFCGK